MKALLKFLVLRFLGWRVVALLALLGFIRSTRAAARRGAAHRWDVER